MPTDYFFLVQQIVTEKKYFDINREQILRQLQATGVTDLETEHHTKDDFANEYGLVLRLNINCKNPTPEGWTIALKLHNVRIDGIDWEPKFKGIDGVTHAGWHRHVWDRRESSAERHKVPIKDMETVTSREEFLVRTFTIMGVTLSATDYGTDELQFD